MKYIDPVIQHEGINENEPPRKKKLRKYSLLSIALFWLKGLIAAVALCVIVGAAGNAIEILARM